MTVIMAGDGNNKHNGFSIPLEILDAGERIKLQLGDMLYDEGTQLECVYVLLNGKVRLFQSHSGEEKTVAVVEHAHDFIGLESVFLKGITETAARSATNTELLKVSPESIKEWLSKNPELESQLRTSALHIKTEANSKWIRQDDNSSKQTARAEAKETTQNSQQSEVAQILNKANDVNETSTEDVTFKGFIRRKFKLYPMVLQRSPMDCGIACMTMVLKHYGMNVSHKRLKELVGLTSQGTDLSSMSEAAEKLGFISRGLRASYDGLLRARLPLICHWDSNHFVVLYEIDKTEALIADPANELTTISRDDFSNHFSMYALELSPLPTLSKGEKESFPLARYLKLLTPHRKTIIDIAAASLAVQILSLSIPLFTQLVVDRVLVHKSITMLNMLVLGVVILILFQTLISSIRVYLVAFVAVKLDQTLFTRFFKHLLSLPLSFFEEHTTGDIISRLQENRKIQNFISGSALTTSVDMLMAVFYLALVFLYSWSFGIGVVFYVLLFTAILVIVTPWLRGLMLKIFQKQVASNSFSIEAIRGVERIKSAASENRTRWAWEELFIDALNTRYRGTLVSRFTGMAAEFVHLIGGILLLWFGAQLVMQDKLSIGQLMALTMIVGRITQPIIYLVDIWDEVQDLGVSFDRISEVLDSEPEETQPESKLNVVVQGNIEFANVTFRYPSNTDVNAVQNLTFSVKPGEMVGIVGRSGCGKTTLLKLLQGLYLPSEGRILVDGHDLKHLSLRDFRRQLGVVSQQDYLFRGTIFDTIAFYNPQASNQDVIDAAKLAGIHDFINTLPKSYQYEVSEGGINLSGGQRQRLCIARALLHNPKILLFDEASSFLDYDSEKALQDNMQKLRKDRTLFVVAHRLSTIRDADRILVLDRGEVLEAGCHDELLRMKGLYYHLWSQAGIS